MRETFEQKSNLEREAALASLISKESKLCGAEWHLKKLPVSYRIDFAAFSETGLKAFVELEAFVEVKVREINSYDYNTLTIGVSKVHQGLSLAEHFSCRFILAIQWKDSCWGKIDLTKDVVAKYKVQWGGRSFNKRDSQDEEPEVCIPLEHFKMYSLVK